MTNDNNEREPVYLETLDSYAVVEKALFELWNTASTLSQLHPPKSPYYRVSIFGSARIEREDALYGQIKSLSSQLSAMGCDIVTGGGPGLMQAANEGENEGDPTNRTRSIGVRVELPFEQGANPYVEKAFLHRTFFSRLQHFLRLSNAFIVVNGGIGTALETLMVWQLLQVKHIENVPLIFLGTMWRELVEWAKRNMVSHTPPLAGASDMAIPQCVETTQEAVALIAEHKLRILG